MLRRGRYDWKKRYAILKISCHTHNLKQVRADYIYHKNEKGKPSKMDFPLFKNDITRFYFGHETCD